MTTTLSRPSAPTGGAAAAPGVSTAHGVVGPSVAAASAVLLASLSIGPLVATSGWFGATLLTVVLVVAVGSLAVWVRVPVFLVPILQAVALFTVLVWRFATDAPLGFFPSLDALAEVRLVLADGMSSINRFAPPIPDSAGVDSVVALGIGCVAIVVFVLAVCLRMPVAAGLALVAVYVVPSFVLDEGSPWWAFAAVAAGWMVLLISDERVGLVSWGRILRRTEASGTRSAVSGLSSTAMRLGAAAIVVAVLLPILIPSLADAVLGRTGNGVGNGTGGDTGTAAAQIGLSPFVSLRRDLVEQPDVVVMTYTTTAAEPAYLRTVVLEQYKDETWTVRDFRTESSSPVTDASALSPPLGGTVETKPQHYSITADKLASPYLPVPEGVAAVRGIAGDWYSDGPTGTIFSKASDTALQSWKVDSFPVAPTVAELQAAQSSTAPDLESLRNSAGIPAAVADQAQTVTAGETTNFGRALALQRWFLANFTYSTDVTSDQTSSYLEQFLKDRKGYCQQFAATMALMARSLGISSRVVVGYTQGTLGPDGTTWIVKAKDAHAWPELEFPGLGWVRFEPTPRGAGQGGTVALPAYTDSSVVTTPAAIPGGTKLPGLALHKLEQLEGRGGGGNGAVLTTPDPGTTADQWRLRGLAAVLMIAAIAGAVPALWRWVRRRRRLSASASVEDAWDELRDTARDLGVAWPDSMTPRQAVASVIDGQRLHGEVAEAATRVGRTTERSRYALTAPDAHGLVSDVSTVRTALLERVDRPTRVRATLLPASLRRTRG